MPRATSIFKLSKLLPVGRLQAILVERYPRFFGTITAVSVMPVPSPTSSQRSAMTMYKLAFGNNESAHHSSLKWHGLHWCMDGSSEFDNFRFEARIAYPKQLERALATPGKGEIIGEGIVLPPRHRYFLDNCIEKVADVLGGGQIVECGITDPSSLVLPLVARVADRVLWLPYPPKDTASEWSEFTKPIDGLLIERKPTATAAKRADQYPLRVLNKGQVTALLGDRDSDGEISSSGTVKITYFGRACKLT